MQVAPYRTVSVGAANRYRARAPLTSSPSLLKPSTRISYEIS